MQSLLVIIPDRLSEIIKKGEMQPRYYNPGRLFDKVDILLCNDDKPDRSALSYLVGGQNVEVHNLPDDLTLVQRRPSFLSSCRLRSWANQGVRLAERINPSLIRCHGADWNCYLASRIKAKLGIPYVVSLHINPDVNPVRRYVRPPFTDEQRRHNRFYNFIESEGLRNADLVMPVYRTIIPYLERLRVKKFEVCYNVLNSIHLQKKAHYELHQPSRIIYVGRLIAEKNPENIIRAVAALPETVLTIVGDGPIRLDLEQLVSDLGLAARVQFRSSVLNDELCHLLAEQDIFAVHSDYWEISKSVLEALLTGLPVVINHRRGEAVPELEGDFVMKVKNSPQDYLGAFQRLLSDDQFREEMGKKAFSHARAHWSPEATEEKYAGIYRSFLQRRNGR